jgi:hypothetical protein
MARHSIRSTEGYLLIDHSASPGLPAGFYTKLGVRGLEVGEGCKFEAPTLTCAHCNAITIINPARTRARGYCRNCDAYVCDGCSARPCKPFALILDEAEKHALKVLKG